MGNERHIVDDPAEVWRDQPLERIEIPLERIRGRALKFERRIWRRNLVEYAAGAIVIATFGYYTLLFPPVLIRVGCGLLIAGALFAMLSLHKRGAARALPGEVATRTCVAFHRRELVEQRDLLFGIWEWYLLPFVPGLSVFLFGLFAWTMKQPNAPSHEGVIITVFAAVALGCALVLAGVGKLNRWTAQKIQLEIDALDELATKA